jgi:hypothetical protein
MKLIKYYFLFLCLFIMGCDSDKDSKYLLEDSIVVTSKSSDIPKKKDGDIYQFAGEGWRIIARINTEIFVTRGSCSGLDRISATELPIGYTLFFKYKPENVDYTYSPNIVRPDIIEAFSPECIQPAVTNLPPSNVSTNI